MKTKYAIYVLFLLTMLSCKEEWELKQNVIFYSSFDKGTTAEVATGDSKIYTAESFDKKDNEEKGVKSDNVRIAEGKGLVGDALGFFAKGDEIIFYKAKNNVAYNKDQWSLAVSFWLQIDPDKDLVTKYCDPIQITDAKYNDAALWVDFNDKSPRDFRLGVIGDNDAWYIKDSDEAPILEKRLVTVNNPSFGHGKWTHVVMNISKLNTDLAKHELFVDGEFKGEVSDINDPFTWDEEKARIMLGINYIGLMDELAIFNKVLTQEEIRRVFDAKGGLKELLN
ncbi:LamG domain-containing protein [Flagellimonas onchidii]|uniref:LamG domain-containing protein n=1 Tax=Flagellimonas onchidii TaxID=2562684 RepID=UPI0010A60442|nr:LamG domain-containing protein [Allomuricauda onchidii]